MEVVNMDTKPGCPGCGRVCHDVRSCVICAGNRYCADCRRLLRLAQSYMVPPAKCNQPHLPL